MIKVVNKYKEPNHIYCGRGSPVGNPFVMNNESQRSAVCSVYEDWFAQQIVQTNNEEFHNFIDMLVTQAEKGDINLGCFCAPRQCHCDTIKEYLDRRLQHGT